MRILLFIGVVTWHVTNSNAMAVTPSSESLNAVTRSVNTFSNNFFKAIAEDESGNLICSPISASMVLAMAAYGARGNTKTQLQRALALPSDDELTKTGIQSLVDSFANFKQVELRLANKIFLAAGFTPKAEFTGVTSTTFRSEAQSVDFGNSIVASKTINQWCEEKTNNRIKDLIKPDDLTSDTALVLVNAVYFKGNWASKFDSNLTEMREFNVDENTKKNVSTMYRSGSYRYGELPQVDAKFVELPYKSEDDNDAVSMVIILPNKINGIVELEKNLGKVTIEELLRGHKQDVNVYLPKFKIESSINLEMPLKKLGLEDMFTKKADFTGIVDAPPLVVSKVIQKAFIEVNEEGSEAAAATGMMITMRCMVHPKMMKVDRPFVYAIVAKTKIDESLTSGSYLFAGRVNDPKP